MKDPYTRLAAILWFLSSHALEELVDVAERIAVERFKTSLDRWAVS